MSGHGSVRRQRSGTYTSYASSRYHQEYPPPQSELSIDSSLVSPLRRASSETRLAVLQQRDVVARLERHMSKKDVELPLPEAEEQPEMMKRDIFSQEFMNETAAAQNTTAAPANTTTTTGTQSDSSYLNMEFDACIQEHPQTKVSPKIINFLGISYKYTKLAIYYIFVILVGVPMTFVWGCVNGSAVFGCVWLWGPALKLFKLCVHSCAPTMVMPLQACCSPAVDVAARIFRQIRAQAIVLGQPALEKIQNA